MRNEIIELLEELQIMAENGDFHLYKISQLQAMINYLDSEEITAIDGTTERG